MLVLVLSSHCHCLYTAINIFTVQQISSEKILFSRKNLVGSYLKYLDCWGLWAGQAIILTSENWEEWVVVVVVSVFCGCKSKSHRAPSPVSSPWLCSDDSDSLTLTASCWASQARTVSQTFRECQILIMKYFWARAGQSNKVINISTLSIPQLSVVKRTR